MRIGRPLTPLTLTPDERTTLEQWTRRRTTAQALALRARIVLRAATGLNLVERFFGLLTEKA